MYNLIDGKVAATKAVTIETEAEPLLNRSVDTK